MLTKDSGKALILSRLFVLELVIGILCFQEAGQDSNRKVFSNRLVVANMFSGYARCGL